MSEAVSWHAGYRLSHAQAVAFAASAHLPLASKASGRALSAEPCNMSGAFAFAAVTGTGTALCTPARVTTVGRAQVSSGEKSTIARAAPAHQGKDGGARVFKAAFDR